MTIYEYDGGGDGNDGNENDGNENDDDGGGDDLMMMMMGTHCHKKIWGIAIIWGIMERK